MKSTNPRFSETDVTFAVKERLGWDDINVFPESVYIEHDCDHEEPYVVDGHVFYGRKAVRYVPERTCRNLNPPSCRDFECSECGESSEFTPGFMPNYCPHCGARVEEASDDADR